MQMQVQDEGQEDMAIRLKFITKVTNMGERILVIFPKEREETKRLKGKFVRITVEEIPVDEEEEK